jgi:hypothetical protein
MLIEHILGIAVVVDIRSESGSPWERFRKEMRISWHQHVSP